jgi:phage baseplate assembly protein W|tara:strand:+ start:922 stop:1332 length:411 start_codon:yes stop_codon:yes gene_type:complete
MPLERVNNGFKDLSMSFQANPLTKDLIALKNENAIARSLKNIVFTLPGEKFFNPEFGSRITASLFENINDVTASIIVDEIISSIERFEPRVELLQPDGVRAFPNYDNNTFDVIIGYTIIGTDVPAQQLEFVLESNR